MATEQIPDLRALRLAYARAIAATEAAETARAVEEAGGRVRLLDAAEGIRAMERLMVAREAVGRACAAELAAGRAFMAALAQAEPACRVCGCTTEDACWDAEHGPCSWKEGR